jgi:hypothetical protein
MDAASACAGLDGLGLKDDFLFGKFLGLTFLLNTGKLIDILRGF